MSLFITATPILCLCIATLPFWDITVVSEHNLGSACGSQPLCYQENNKKKRKMRMMERISFISSIFRSRKGLTKEVKQRREERSSGTMPFPFEKEEKLHRNEGHLDHEILSEYLAE